MKRSLLSNVKLHTLAQTLALALTLALTGCGGAGGGAVEQAPHSAGILVSADDAIDLPHDSEGPPGSVLEPEPSETRAGESGDTQVQAQLEQGAFDQAGYGPDGASDILPKAGDLYVSERGSDANPGTDRQPFRTLARAARAARAGIAVHVAPGVYAGGIRSDVSGSAGARIVFLSSVKWGARIVPPAKSVNKVGWDNRGSYVDIIGFDFDGRAHQSGTRWTHGIYNGGSYAAIRNNHVHHIAQGVDCDRAGGAAIGVDSYFGGIASDVIGNSVHDIGPADCRYVQGIYMSTSGSIQNNVVYRVAGGGIHLWHDARNVIITNNTVTASNTGIIVGGGNFYTTRGPNDYTAVYSNIVVDNSIGISEQGSTGRNNSYRNNLVFRNGSYNWRLKNGLQHTETVSAAPLFAEGGRSDMPPLKLSPASPAIGRASPTHAATTDFEGRARNAGTGFDIGAFQH